MTIADDIAAIWAGIGNKPTNDKAKYYTDLLRRTMLSKKSVEESGRKYSVLPMLRDLTRKTMVRVPAEKVDFLEVTVFDLIANPLKKNLQPYVSEFCNEDIPLVDWFAKYAKKEPSIAFDVKTLEAWLETKKPEAKVETAGNTMQAPAEPEGARAEGWEGKKPVETEGAEGEKSVNFEGEKTQDAGEKENLQKQPNAAEETREAQQPESREKQCPSALEEKGMWGKAEDENPMPEEIDALDGEGQKNPDAPDETETKDDDEKEQDGEEPENSDSPEENGELKGQAEEPPGFLEEEAEDPLARELTENELEKDG